MRGSYGPKFDKYFTYDELTEWLKKKASQYSNFIDLESIGLSHEERDVWAVTLTNKETGSAEHKPAVYVDGNIHAGEVTGSMICLYLIDYLVENFSTDDHAAKLLNDRVFYIIPRANPDGAEKYLTTPETLRSSVRIYPEYRKDEDPPGLHTEDIDGDGRILLMRVRDDARGAWKADSEDPRLMVERTPLDLEGPFYHIYSEGRVRDEDGELVEEPEIPFRPVPTEYGLDLNRNFPAGYDPKTKGAGPYPLSEPETQNLVEFISEHNNIGAAAIFHTTGGVLFRPHSTIADEDFNKEDMDMYKTLGQMGTDATGYPVVCCYGDIWSGVLDDWCWEHRGIYAFTPELWDAVGRAAPEMKKPPQEMSQMNREERRKLALRLLKWNDTELAGEGFIPWYRYNHPQLGEVELGGWVTKKCRQNPPENLLSAECHKNIKFPIALGLSLPEVHIDEIQVSQLSECDYLLSVVVSNHGYLDTRISKQAEKQQAVRKDVVKLAVDDSVGLLSGQKVTEIDHLQGYASGQASRFYRVGEPAESARRLKWTLRLREPQSTQIEVVLQSERGGTDKTSVNFGESD